MIEIISLKKSFGNGNLVLDNLTMSVSDGDFIIIMGGNGSGKSTLFNCLMGIYPIDSGEVRIAKVNISNLSQYQKTVVWGRVFQDPFVGTFPNLNILENLSLGLNKSRKWHLTKLISKKQSMIIEEFLNTYKIEFLSDFKKSVSMLSGGQRQVLSLIMAVLGKPKLLLLDEPTSALDPVMSQKVLELIKMIVEKEKITTLMITHDVNDAVRYGDKLFIIQKGKVVETRENVAKTSLCEQQLKALLAKYI